MGKGGAYATVAADEMEKLRRRNGELEREMEEMKKEMIQLWRRTVVAEEAEERLCSQLAELEVESLDQAREYESRIHFLVDQISRLSSSSLEVVVMNS
ncbi:protein RESPONSE TO LOW SULFUR 3 [Raphanus sativus]|uniref:Protein RESPONSE TO LOW SULFUR 3 n=1 Tax=Raphanus sativus TaxID=3726 RepID=A0A6J0JM25_RAPSA|nr:protein RESPONSE TO LOW SULFUR 3 [Raphanus sativus]